MYGSLEAGENWTGEAGEELWIEVELLRQKEQGGV